MATTKNLTTIVFFKSLSLLALVSFAAAVLVFPGVAEAKKKAKISGENNKYGSIVMDADTGEILSQSNADKSLHPASLTKVMTLLLLFEAVERGETSLGSKIKISKYAANMAPSKLGLAPGSSIKVKDAIYALVTKSANDVSAAIGEHLAGSESAFARRMTTRAHELGMTNTRFVNASGLHHPSQVSSPRDMAKLARFVIVQYPQYYRYFSTTNFKYQGKNYHNHNRLMESYKGMDGMKTGFTNPSGFNLIASAVRNNRRIIGVVFGGRSTQSRNDHMAQLLDRGFATKSDVRIAEARPNSKLTATSDDYAPAQFVSRNESVIAPPAGQVPILKGPTLLATNLPSPNSKVPLPGHKPAVTKAIAAILEPQELRSSDVNAQPQRVADAGAHILRAPDESKYEELTGQGDFDPAVYKRIDAGMSAIAAHKGAETKNADLHRVLTAAAAQGGNAAPNNTTQATPASFRPEQRAAGNGAWSVQIGAFTSRAVTDQALQRVLKQIPAPYSQAQPMIAPLKTAGGWLFRGRLTGFTRTEALAACNYIRDCLPVAPQN